MTSKVAAFHQRSIQDKEGFWGEQAQTVDWFTKPEKVLDFSNPPFAKWFVGGKTNICYNAIDRHLATRGDQIKEALKDAAERDGRQYASSFQSLLWQENKIELEKLKVKKEDVEKLTNLKFK